MGRKSSIAAPSMRLLRAIPEIKLSPGRLRSRAEVVTVAPSIPEASASKGGPPVSNEPDDITRRDFVSRTATAVAGVALGGSAIARAQSGTVGSRVPGANDRLALATVGVRGQRTALQRGLSHLNNVQIHTIADLHA